MNATIKAHGGSGRIYPYCSDGLNKATTGHTSEEICVIAEVRETRDGLDTSHLALQLLGESEQIKAMDREKVQGNAAIQQAVDPVHETIEKIALRFNLHNEKLLYDHSPRVSGGTVRTLALPIPQRDKSQYACRDYYGETPFDPQLDCCI